MAVIEGGASGALQEVENLNKAARVSLFPRGEAYTVSGTTGTIAAALGANSSLFAMRYDPGAGSLKANIDRVRLQWTTIAAFTTAITAGRRLEIYRGSGAAASGGTAIALAAQKDSTGNPSECNSAQGGDMRISSTGALTVTGITYEAVPMAVMSLAHLGAAGAYAEQVFEFNATESAPLILQPGQLLAVRNPVAMDAGGTWQLAVKVDWFEA